MKILGFNLRLITLFRVLLVNSKNTDELILFLVPISIGQRIVCIANSELALVLKPVIFSRGEGCYGSRTVAIVF